MALIVPARTRLVFVSLRDTVILRIFLIDVLAYVGSTCSLMFTLGIESIRVNAIYWLVCTRARCVNDFEH